MALHCAHHDYSRLYQSPWSYRADLQELETGLQELGIPYERLVRLPGGSLNTRATPKTLEQILDGLKQDGYTIFD